MELLTCSVSRKHGSLLAMLRKIERRGSTALVLIPAWGDSRQGQAGGDKTQGLLSCL